MAEVHSVLRLSGLKAERMQLTLTLTVAATVERSVMDVSIKAPLP